MSTGTQSRPHLQENISVGHCSNEGSNFEPDPFRGCGRHSHHRQFAGRRRVRGENDNLVLGKTLSEPGSLGTQIYAI